MRSIWKGAVSFGLVTVPIRLYAATESKDVRFHMLHQRDGSRIEYRKFCAEEDVEVPNEELTRGYEFAKGRYVTIDDKDTENLPLSTEHAIEILEFVDLPEIDPIYFEKSYYLEPQDGAAKPYALLREAMKRANKTAVAKIVLRDKEHLATVRSYGDALVLETLFYPDEIRETEQLEGLNGQQKFNDKEVQMAISLIEALSAEFDATKYQDNYREALLELINQKIEGKPIEAPAARPAAKVMDLMEALRASVEMAGKNTPSRQAKEKVA
ncbi:MAG: non-homologous end joining protein Ku [Chloroflexota bacterium]